MSRIGGRIHQLSKLLSRKLHIPAGAAVVVAILLVPKVLAIMMVMWYILSVIKMRVKR